MTKYVYTLVFSFFNQVLKQRAQAQAAHDTKATADRAKRFEFLMGQADIFAHFMADRKTSAATAASEATEGNAEEPSSSSGPKKRGRPKKGAERFTGSGAGAGPSSAAAGSNE